MPRIDAPTVAEHRSRQRAALIAAAEDLLANGGVDSVTLGRVGAQAGLARSSVYQYFSSTPALIAAVVEDAFPRSTEKLRRAVARAASPIEKVDAYLVTALDLASDPAHRSLAALASAELPTECRARIAELHEEQSAPLRDAVAQLGVDDPDLSMALLLGVLHAATQVVIDSASSRKRVTRELLDFVHRGIASPA